MAQPHVAQPQTGSPRSLVRRQPKDVKALFPQESQGRPPGVFSELCSPSAFTEPAGLVLGTPIEAYARRGQPGGILSDLLRTSEAVCAQLFRWLGIFP